MHTHDGLLSLVYFVCLSGLFLPADLSYAVAQSSPPPQTPATIVATREYCSLFRICRDGVELRMNT